MLRSVLKTLIPNRLLVAARFATRPEIADLPLVSIPNAAGILSRIVNDYGYGVALCRDMPVNGEGDPLPWYTYPMIEYLSSFDFSDCRVFEYGCGNSTLWWAGRAGEVVSVENNLSWHERMVSQAPPNATIVLEEDPIRFARSAREYGKFDVIVVDGEVARYDSCIEAVDCLNPGGAVILDNADCLPNCSNYLRDSGLFEIAMNGFTPLIVRASRTSLFIDQPTNLKPLGHRPAVAGSSEPWVNLDQPTTDEMKA